MQDSSTKATLWFMRASTLLIIVLAVIGGIRNHTAVPVWDMWDGHLNFFLQQQEDWRWWFAQHNEHRIVLARLLFWMDLQWFRGQAWFLVAMNYVLVGLACWLFHCIVRERLAGLASPRTIAVVSLGFTAWLFSWAQNDNLTWAFQSQFFLAQLVPLAAFYALHRYAAGPSPAAHGWFIWATVLGVASAGTMANGVLALPLMVLLALMLRLRWPCVAILAVLSAAMLAWYFRSFQSHVGDETVTGALLLADPWKSLRYICAYLGNPFFHLLGGTMGVRTFAQLAGLAMILACAVLAIRQIPPRNRQTLVLALLAFLLYIGATAASTASGRVLYGIAQALEHRYATPGLMAWAALAAILLPALMARMTSRRIRAAACIALVALLLPYQLSALGPLRHWRHTLDHVALTTELGVQDDPVIHTAFYDPPRTYAIVDPARAQGLSLWGHGALHGLREQLEQPYTGTIPSATCRGELQYAAPIASDARFLQVQGWLADAAGQQAPHMLRVIGSDRRTVGFALGQVPLKLVPHVLVDEADSKPPRIGFFGYVLADQAGHAVTLVSDALDCHLPPARLQPPPVTLLPYEGAEDQVTVEDEQIVENGWSGADYYRSQFAQLHTVGSHWSGDADKGTVRLHLRKGDQLLFRTGPSATGQHLHILHDDQPAIFRLPEAVEWMLLVFDSPTLPETFEAIFEDAGDGWGQWSAIAVKRKP